METPQPPQLAAARTQLEQVLEQVEKKKVDLLTTPWAEVEKSVIKVLGGPFQIDQPEHQMIALGLAASFGARLAVEHKAFWFPSRESPEGAAIGFPDALIMLSPFGAVLDALMSSKLEKLEDVAKDIRTSLAQVKFGAAGGGLGQQKLGVGDYQRLFDPGFVQVLAIDGAKALTAWGTAPNRLALDIKDSLGRVGSKLPDQVKQQLEAQLVQALQRMEPGKPLIEQLARGPRVAELVGSLWGSSASTGSAPEEFWQDVVMPLAYIGVPEKFPELDEESAQAAKQGVHPFFLFLDVVPFSTPAPEDEGLLGAFPANTLALPHKAFEAVGNVRLIKVGTDAVKGPLEKFDAAKTRDAVKRFGEYLKTQGGAAVADQGKEEAEQMLNAAISLLEELKKIVTSGKDVYVRRLTEAEAGAEGAMAVLRGALQGPRIILA